MQRLIGILVLVAALTAGWYWMDYQNFLRTPLTVPAEGLVVQVERGSNLRRLARRLQQQGVLRSADLLYWHARWQELANRIRAGEYRVPPGTTPDGLLRILVSGRTVEYPLTLVEGWTFRQVRAALARDPVLEKTLEGKSDAEVMALLGHPDEHPEGRFFPDTYRFPRGTTDLDLLRRAYRRMQQVLAEEWAQRSPDIAVKTPYEALILASIVEKETGVAEERPLIAGVFTRRLERGMKLQTDPTVIYGMGERYDGNIRRRDLREDTPYNTYVHAGLPPTPICMPGREAIHAVLHPAEGRALYFVARGDGRHVFSETLKQHNAAVRKYQLKR